MRSSSISSIADGSMFRALFDWSAPAGPRARLSLLIYHRVVRAADPLFLDIPDAGRFERTMLWVKQWFNVLPLPVAVERLRLGTLPARPLSITFDDGYADNEAVALPILSRLEMPATFFIATGFLDDGGLMWNDSVIESIRSCEFDTLDLSALGLGVFPLGSITMRRAAIDTLLATIMHYAPSRRAESVVAIAEAAGGTVKGNFMMSSEQIRRLSAAGMTIGGHTVTHPILARLDPHTAKREIDEGKMRLEEIIGDRIDLFAYPSGRPGRDYAAEHTEMVRECGFRAAVSTAWGVATAGADCFQLPRFTPWDRSQWRFGLRLAQNLRRTNYAMA
jgi:peptidoglycan/xylan/chitin deacetylase (PgdA/CDA1 family)